MNYITLIINLDKDLDRWKFMKNQFQNLNIEIQRLSGVSGKEFNWEKSDEYNTQNAVNKNGKDLNLGERGCAFSHKKTWEKLLEENKKNKEIKYALICEDDILIKDKNFKKIIEKYIKENEENEVSEKHINFKKNNTWEYLQFDYQKPGIDWIRAWFVQVYLTFIIKQTFKEKLEHLILSICKIPFVIVFAFYEGFRNNFYIGLVFFKRDVYMAGCYIVNLNGAKKLIELQTPITYTADRIQNEAKNQRNLKIRYYCPVIVFQQRKLFTTNIGK